MRKFASTLILAFMFNIILGGNSIAITNLDTNFDGNNLSNTYIKFSTGTSGDYSQVTRIEFTGTGNLTTNIPKQSNILRPGDLKLVDKSSNEEIPIRSVQDSFDPDAPIPAKVSLTIDQEKLAENKNYKIVATSSIINFGLSIIFSSIENEEIHITLKAGNRIIASSDRDDSQNQQPGASLPGDGVIPGEDDKVSEDREGLVTAEKGGNIKVNGVTVVIPANAVTSDVKISVEKLAEISHLPLDRNEKIIGEVFEITKDSMDGFEKPVTITLPLDLSKVELDKYDLGLFWLNEDIQKWERLENIKVDFEAGVVSGEIDHFTKFAVIATEKEAEEPEEKQSVSLTDIDNHWAKENIETLVSTGTIGGYPDGTFRPEGNITRAEFATILVKAFDFEKKSGNVFVDTKEHWAKDTISTAAANGIINGYGENRFGPDDYITREQMAVMIVNAAKLSITSSTHEFVDSDSISEWAKSSVGTASEHNIISGYPGNLFKPKGNAKRAEAATVVVNALEL